MIQEFFSCIFCITVLEEFIVQGNQLSSMEDDHICKLIINTYHHQILFRKKKYLQHSPPHHPRSLQIGKCRLGKRVRCTSTPQRGGEARSARGGEGVGTPDPFLPYLAMKRTPLLLACHRPHPPAIPHFICQHVLSQRFLSYF